MFSRRIVSFVMVLAFVCALSAQAGAQGRMQPEMGRLQRFERLKNYLALTDAQVTQMRGLVKAHHDTVVPLRAEMRDKREAIRAALNLAEPNATTIGQLVIAEHGLQTQVKNLNKKLNDDFIAILTPEQKVKFEDLKKLRPGRGAERMP
jgi:Spy/CpxP family protein refolding chaperone